jgi:rRNA maturation endonuclease Nob1
MSLRVSWCNRCHEIFDSPSSGDRRCPLCGRCDVKLLKRCVPDAGLADGPAPYELVCHQCDTYFEVQSPRDPDEAKRIHCPICGQRVLERLHIDGIESMEHTCYG